MLHKRVYLDISLFLDSRKVVCHIRRACLDRMQRTQTSALRSRRCLWTCEINSSAYPSVCSQGQDIIGPGGTKTQPRPGTSPHDSLTAWDVASEAAMLKDICRPARFSGTHFCRPIARETTLQAEMHGDGNRCGDQILLLWASRPSSKRTAVC